MSYNELTRAGGQVPSAVTGGPMFEVVVAGVGPEAAIVEAEDVIDPVGEPRNPRWSLVGRRAPVVSPVWSATSNGVRCQDLSSGAVVTALLSCGILRTGDKCPKHVSIIFV